MGCDYGEVHAIIVWDNSSLEIRNSEIKKNKGKHALIKMYGKSKLDLEDVTFDDNTTTETLPIIIDKYGEEGNIKIYNCKFVNHNCFNSYVMKEKEK